MARWDRHGDDVDLSDPIVLGWLAGLLEGEGSFVWCKRSASQRHRQPQIKIQMCDEDVIRRLAALWGAAVHRREPVKAHWSPSWMTKVGGRKAVIVMQAILPYMGERRSAKIQEILEEVADWYTITETPSWQASSIGFEKSTLASNLAS